MRSFIRLIENAQRLSIEPMKPDELDEVLECFERNFNHPGQAIEPEFAGAQCFVARDGEKIVGFYLLKPKSLEAHFPKLAGHKYTGRGVQGVALCLDAEYRGSGLGKQMMDLPVRIGDYVWGMHLHELNNLHHWTKRRDFVVDTMDDGDPVYVTAAQLR